MAVTEDVERGHNSRQEEVQQPHTVAKEAIINDGDYDKDKARSSGHPWMVYLSTCVAVCGSYEFGACVGYSSPTQSAITEELGLSTAEFSLFGSILTFGAMFGAITSGPIADFMGRKWAMRIYASFCVAGWLAIYFAKGSLVLDIGRIAGGYGMGAFSYVVPVYIAEIAPVNIRGALTTLNQVMISTGVSVAFVVGLIVSWRSLALTGLIPCVVMLLGLFFIPESPRWLARREDEKFRVVLQKLRGQDVDISQEAADIQSNIEELQQHPKANFLDLFQKNKRRSLIVGVGLMILQQIGGINGICFYTSNIFRTAGFSPKIGTLIYALLQVVITSIVATFIDKVGRRPLQLV